MSLHYEIRSGLVDKVDYNGDGKVDGNDNVVVKYINNVPVGQIVLTSRNEKKLLELLRSHPAKQMNINVNKNNKVNRVNNTYNNMPQKPQQAQPQEHNQRILYQRSPRRDPPPLVVKDGTEFGQQLKNGVGLGAGLAIGEMAVEGAVGFLGDLF